MRLRKPGFRSFHDAVLMRHGRRLRLRDGENPDGDDAGRFPFIAALSENPAEKLILSAISRAGHRPVSGLRLKLKTGDAE